MSQMTRDNPFPNGLMEKLNSLKRSYSAANFETAAQSAMDEQWSYPAYLEELAVGEANLKQDRSIFSRLDQWIRMRLRSILRRRLKGKGRGRGIDHHR